MKLTDHQARLIRAAGLLALITSAFVTAPRVAAERLHFTDGESITGTLLGIEAGKVSWKSGILGELTVDQQYVQKIESRQHFDLKLTGMELHNCWMILQDNKQLLMCDEGTEKLSDWKLVVAAGAAVTEPRPRLTQTGNLRLAAEDSTGNNAITKYNLEARGELRLVESRHTLNLRYREETLEEVPMRNSWRTGYQYDQFFTEQWFVTGVGLWEEDDFREIDSRSSVGVGMGYQFLETRYFNLLGKTTLNYVDERFSSALDRTTMAFLWNLDFGWKINDRGMEFFHRHGVLQAFDHGEDWEVTTTTGFKYPINGHFSSTVQLDFDYDNLPAEELVDKRDRKWSIGVNYDW